MASRGEKIADIGAALDAPMDAPEFAQAGDVGTFGGHEEDDDLDAPPLPPECPITPLGVLGQACWYLDVNGQIIPLEMANKHGKNSLIGMFGKRRGWLEANFPQWSKPVREYDHANKRWEVIKESEIIGFDQAKASDALIVECTRRGIFDPAGKIRGAGAHRGNGDALVIHCGNSVMRRGLRIDGSPDDIVFYPTGVHGEHVYPAAPSIPRPWPEPVGYTVAIAALALIKQWHWKRELLDPVLVLGGMGAAMVGGALDWRPNIWITGGKGTGKSTLNGKRGLLDLMMGKGQLRSADTTAAGLRQRLRNSTVPVFLDELEAEEDLRRTKSILELARVSSSGDDAHRGGQDHKAMEFTLQSSFWASSIVIPPMAPADKSRWAICALRPIREGAKRPEMKPAKMAEMGQQLLRRMIDGWWRWSATFEAYQDALSAMGNNSRACDQFGTLLAAYDLLMFDGALDIERVGQVTELCAGNVLREVSEAAEEDELCLLHLCTTQAQSRGGDERQSIGTWIGNAVQELCGPRDLGGKLGDLAKYHRQLGELGLKLVYRTVKGAAEWKPGKRGYLAVANTHQALSAVFASTTWQKGGWSQVLGRCPDAVEDGVTVKIGMKPMRCTLVPLEAVIDESEIPKSARWNEEGEG